MVDEKQRKSKTLTKLKSRFRDLILQFTCILDDKDNQKLILKHFEIFLKRNLLAKQVMRAKKVKQFQKNLDKNK